MRPRARNIFHQHIFCGNSHVHTELFRPTIHAYAIVTIIDENVPNDSITARGEVNAILTTVQQLHSPRVSED
jgi:hypothetical protein